MYRHFTLRVKTSEIKYKEKPVPNSSHNELHFGDCGEKKLKDDSSITLVYFL